MIYVYNYVYNLLSNICVHILRQDGYDRMCTMARVCMYYSEIDNKKERKTTVCFNVVYILAYDFASYPLTSNRRYDTEDVFSQALKQSEYITGFTFCI